MGVVLPAICNHPHPNLPPSRGKGWLCPSTTPPSRPLRSIFEYDAGIQQFLADAIGFGELFRFPRRGSGSNQLFDRFARVADNPRSVHRRWLGRKTPLTGHGSLEEDHGIPLQQSQDSAE